MATSSIIKEYIVKDSTAYLKLMYEINNRQNSSKKTVVTSSSIEKGKRLFNQFSFR